MNITPGTGTLGDSITIDELAAEIRQFDLWQATAGGTLTEGTPTYTIKQNSIRIAQAAASEDSLIITAIAIASDKTITIRGAIKDSTDGATSYIGLLDAVGGINSSTENILLSDNNGNGGLRLTTTDSVSTDSTAITGDVEDLANIKFVRDGTDSVECYIDGVLKATNTDNVSDLALGAAVGGRGTGTEATWAEYQSVRVED